MNAQSGGNPNRDNFGTPPWESRDKKPFECRCRGEAPPSPGRGESMLPMACPNTKSDSECELTNLLVGFDAGPNNKISCPLPSLIPELSAHPSHPALVLEAGSGTKFQLLPLSNIVGPLVGLTRNLGAHQAS